MAATFANVDALLKEYYLPGVRNQLNDSIQTLKLLQQKGTPVEGRRAVLSLEIGRNPTVFARLDGGTFPTEIGEDVYAEQRVPVKRLYALGQLTGQAMKAAKTDKGSFARTMQRALDRQMVNLKRDVNRQLWGTSDGALVACGLTTNSTTLNLSATATINQVRNIVKNARVDVGTVAQAAAGAGGRAHNIQVTAVDTANYTLTLSQATTASADTDFVFIAGNGGATTAARELTGIPTMVDSSGALFNVDPATYPEWAATELGNSGTPRAISDSLLAQAIHGAEIASGEQPDYGVCGYEVHRAYANYLQAQKRFPGTTKLDGGYTAITCSAGGASIPLVAERDCPSTRGTVKGGDVYFLNSKHLGLAEETDWEFIDDDGSILHWTGTSDAFTFGIRKFAEAYTDKRNAHAVVRDILGA